MFSIYYTIIELVVHDKLWCQCFLIPIRCNGDSNTNAIRFLLVIKSNDVETFLFVIKFKVIYMSPYIRRVRRRTYTMIAWTMEYNKLKHTNITKNEITYWDSGMILPVSAEEISKIFNYVWQHCWQEIPPSEPGQSEIIKKSIVEVIEFLF